MSITMPIPIQNPMGSSQMTYKTSREVQMKPKSPPKLLPKRKLGFRDKHIYERVPLDGLFQKSSPVIDFKKQMSPPGKLSPSLLNFLNTNLREKPSSTQLCKVEANTTSKPDKNLKSDKGLAPLSPNKVKRQGCPDLEEQVDKKIVSDEGPTDVKTEDNDPKEASTDEQAPASENKLIRDGHSPEEKGKCEDGGCGSSVTEHDAETSKTETVISFVSDHRSTTCSASSACSTSSSSTFSPSNTSSESSDSSIAKDFFTTPNLGSSTPKRIGSPKNRTPEENLYDTWGLDENPKAEPNTNSQAPAKKSNKSSGYYAEVTEYLPTQSKDGSPEMQDPSPPEFFNKSHPAREQAVYINVPTLTRSRSSLNSKRWQRDHYMEDVVITNYASPKDQCVDAPNCKTDDSKLENPTEKETLNEYETPLEMGTIATQTHLDVVTVSCECGEFLRLPPDMEDIVDQLKQERSMRMVSDQLVKMVEVEVKELKEDLLKKKSDLVLALEEKQSAQGELREATKIAAQYRVQIGELEKELAQEKEEVVKLKETTAKEAASSIESKENTELDLDKRIAEAKDTEAKNRLEVVQAELLASQDEVNRLLAHLAQATREKAEMVSSKVHQELMRLTEERANQAEIKALALERELRRMLGNRILSETLPKEPPEIPPRRDELKNPLPAAGFRTAPQYIPKHATLYSRGTMANKRGQPTGGGRNTAGVLIGNKRVAAQNMKYWSLGRLKNVEGDNKREKGGKSEDLKDIKSAGKMSFLQRVQSRVSNTHTKSEVQKSLFDRMQSRFFAKSPKAEAKSTNCELPDVSTLEESFCKSEYEIPMESVQRLAARPPLIGE